MLSITVGSALRPFSWGDDPRGVKVVAKVHVHHVAVRCCLINKQNLITNTVARCVNANVLNVIDDGAHAVLAATIHQIQTTSWWWYTICRSQLSIQLFMMRNAITPSANTDSDSFHHVDGAVMAMVPFSMSYSMMVVLLNSLCAGLPYSSSSFYRFVTLLHYH